mgnify:FL=1
MSEYVGNYVIKIEEENKKLREAVKDFHETLNFIADNLEMDRNAYFAINAIEKHEQFLKGLE